MEAIQQGACWLALVVDSDERLLGVVTDGDVRRALLAGKSLDDRIEPHMHRDFTTVTPSAGRTEILDLMRARSFNQIPIVDKRGTLVGLHLLRELVGASNGPIGPSSWRAAAASDSAP